MNNSNQIKKLQREIAQLKMEVMTAKAALEQAEKLKAIYLESMETAKAAREQYEQAYRDCLVAKKSFLKEIEKWR